MKPSTSAILAQQVNVGIGSAGEGFLMTVSPTTFSVGAGSSVSVAVTILDLNNFNLPVTLGCSGLPAEATCTFSTPVIVAPAAHNAADYHRQRAPQLWLEHALLCRRFGKHGATHPCDGSLRLLRPSSPHPQRHSARGDSLPSAGDQWLRWQLHRSWGEARHLHLHGHRNDGWRCSCNGSGSCGRCRTIPGTSQSQTMIMTVTI